MSWRIVRDPHGSGYMWRVRDGKREFRRSGRRSNSWMSYSRGHRWFLCRTTKRVAMWLDLAMNPHEL